ncbi:MAG: hypothetical protein ACI83Y_001782 [Candidatus Azotimanducaceae bacterium]|jgi:hypothetical protein|tara:strand:+ start:1332 stop:1814 length:483 start_codon:yes stop_codon:yes gene_type:complete
MSLTLSAERPRSSFHIARSASEQQSLVGSAAALPWVVAGCLASTAAYVVIYDPGDGNGGLASCPIRALTGHWCPGCGITRATHHLFRGNIAQALSFNAFVPAILAALSLLWVTWLMVVIGRGVPTVICRIKPAAYVSAALVLAGFTVVRNLSGAVLLRGG